MASISPLLVSPNSLMSLYGLAHGPDRTVPTPAEDWRKAVVDVVIPALDEEETLPFALASIARQTLRPRQVLVIDDGSRDRTVQYAESYAAATGLPVKVIRRARPIGKTPTLKRQARELDADVEFILDGDTVLESDNYLERVVQELYQAAGIASACGTILPLRDRDRRNWHAWPQLEQFHAREPQAKETPDRSRWQLLTRGLTNMYRDALYMFLQKFVYRGQMAIFGTITNPVGCAVAYRRKYVQDLFDRYEPVLGDDLTNSEDIFIGFAMLAKGYRNIQVPDVQARSQEPRAQRLPRQMYLWSSSFLQSCFYFDELLRSPLRAWRRARHERKVQREQGERIRELRKIQEPYRQPWGEAYTERFGRPVGWTLLLSALEKIGYPTALLVMVVMQLWEPLAITIAAETALVLFALTVVARGQRAEYFLKGLLMTPVRYAGVAFDMVTIGRFASDLWVRRDRRWRK